MIGLLIDLT
ncbi:hypothetical protein KOSB73_260772 [Klebsiella grimontii]|uniref:Uncharacterized protein n=1 Tax=Klebsiella grimontii TaxID=2058152 RepID=A0A285B594_9ENTR|nr:hypothetical protein KOSB73_260772 [Klebsiella grimontii]